MQMEIAPYHTIHLGIVPDFFQLLKNVLGLKCVADQALEECDGDDSQVEEDGENDGNDDVDEETEDDDDGAIQSRGQSSKGHTKRKRGSNKKTTRRSLKKTKPMHTPGSKSVPDAGVKKSSVRCSSVADSSKQRMRKARAWVGINCVKPGDKVIAEKVVRARLRHFILRSWPSCRVPDVFKHSGQMICEEWQLLMDCASVYIMHDLETFGVNEEIMVMWCAFCYDSSTSRSSQSYMLCVCRAFLRTACLLLFRPIMLGSPEEEDMCHDIIQACLSGYFIVAELVFGDHTKRFKFTYKGHMATAHLVQQMLATGHPCFNSDLFVERALRCYACKSCRWAYGYVMLPNIILFFLLIGKLFQCCTERVQGIFGYATLE